MFEIKIHDKDVMNALDQMSSAGQNMSPVMRMISTELTRQTEANLEAEGRPKWLGLKPATIAARTRRGSWPGKIMQESGQLAASFTSGYDSDSAWIGSNKKYAAIQHAGGQAGRGRKVKIEPRPSIPTDAQGRLQSEAGENILGLVSSYLKNLIR